MGTAIRTRAEVRKLLREAGLRPEDIPGYLRNSTLFHWAKRFPPEMRVEYFEALLEFFRIYEQLDDVGREEMLGRFNEMLGTNQK